MLLLNQLIVQVLLCTQFFTLDLSAQNRSKPLYIVGLYPDIDSIWTAPLMRVMGDLAVEYIHNTTDILPNHKMIIVWRQSQCDAKISINQVLELLINDNNITYKAVFGPACSVSTEPLAEILPSFYLNLISYSSTSPTLADTNRFPTLTLGSPIDSKSISIWVNLVKYYKWRRVSILYSLNVLFIKISQLLQAKLNEMGVEVRSEGLDTYNLQNGDASNITRKLEILFLEEKYRIVIGNFYEDVARDVLCLAKKQDYIYPKISWLLPGWYTKSWYDGSNVIGNCTSEEIKTASNGALGYLGIPSRNRTLRDNANTIFNVKQNDIINRFYLKSNEIYGSSEADLDTDSNYELYSFDSMVTLALALNELENIYPGKIEEFDYKNLSNQLANYNYMTNLTKLMHSVSFKGLGGDVKYFIASRLENRSQIVEFHNGQVEIVFDIENMPEEISENFDESKLRLFGKQGPPLDGVILFHLPIWVYSIIVMLMVISLIYIGFIFVVHVVYRKKKVFKMSSPLINFIILFGCIIEIFAVLPYLVDNFAYKRIPEDTSLCWYCSLMCHLRYVLPAIAKDLIFGSLIGKSLRLYIVAVRINININKIFNDWKVAIFVLVLVLVDIAYNIIWGAIPGIRLQYVTNGISKYQADSNTPFRIIYDCLPGGKSNDPTEWVLIIYSVLRSTLYIVGIFIAFLIRKVKIRGVNEYVPIAYATLVTVMLTFLRLFLGKVIFDWYEYALVLICLSFLLDTVLVVSFLFIPKLYFVVKDPNEERLYTNRPSNETLTNDIINKVKRESIEMEILSLEKRRDSLSFELTTIKEKDEVFSISNENANKLETTSNGNFL